MGHGKHKGFSRRRLSPPPIADYNVTGDPNPDCKCNYWDTGWHNGKPYYRREDGEYFIWWSIALGGWAIGIHLGVIGGAGFWHRIDPNIEGVYNPAGVFAGNPVVAAGPH